MEGWIIGLLIFAVVTAVSLVIISNLPLGIDIDSFPKAFLSGLVIGALNSLVLPLLSSLRLLNLLTLGLFGLIATAIVFGLAAFLVPGFRLRWGFVSALLGAIALSFINSFLFWLLGRFGIYTQLAG